jgi:hypothetical protein
VGDDRELLLQVALDPVAQPLDLSGAEVVAASRCRTVQAGARVVVGWRTPRPAV